VWRLRWSSESVEYGGGGTARMDLFAVPHLIGDSAVLFCAVPAEAGEAPEDRDHD
jgi:hypothetical protein